MWKIPIIVLFVVFVVVDKCFALECYICDSTTEPKCVDLKDKSIKAETCTYEKLSMHGAAKTSWLMTVTELDYYRSKHQEIPMVCQKIVGTDEKNGQTTVRRCQLNHVEQCDYAKHRAIAQRSNTIEHCSVCDQDRCNTSSGLYFAWHSILLALLARILLW